MAWQVLALFGIFLGWDGFYFHDLSPQAVEGVTGVALFVAATGEMAYQISVRRG
jgi:hypothetical protein